MKRILLGELWFAACLFIGLGHASPAVAQAESPTVAQSLSGLTTDIEALRKIYGTPGLAVAIVKDGKLIYAEGLGYRNIAERLPATPETIFPTGSVTKQFTAALIGIRAGEAALSLSDRPVRHLPELRFRTDEMNNLVTIADLLSHQSGIGNVDATHAFFPTDNRRQHLARLRYLTPNSDVRERFDYSNMGYAVLAAIDERIAGQPWEREIETRIFEPLNMTRSSTTVPGLESSDNIAVGYGMIDGRPHHALYENQHEAGPSGAINSTVLDLSKWMTMLLNEGRVANAQIVPANFIANAFSAHTMINPTYNARTKALRLDAYGYGWFISEYEGHYRVNHGGNTSGFTARIDMLPGENLGIAILTNQQSTELPRYIADMVYRRMLGLPPKDVKDYPLQVTDATAIVPVNKPNRASPPNHGLEEFVGRYSNPGYGSFDVTLRQDVLYAVFPAFSFALEHRQHDVFVTKPYYEIHQNSPSFPVNFQANTEGNIGGAMIPLQAESVLFVRERDEGDEES